MKNLIRIAGIITISATLITAENADSLRAEIQRLQAQLQKTELIEEAPIEPEEIAIEEATIQVEPEEEVIEEAEPVAEVTKIESVPDDTLRYQNDFNYSSSKKDVSVRVTRNDSSLTIVRVKTDKNDSTASTDTTIKTIRIFPKFFDGDKKNGDWHGNIIGIGGGLGIGGILVDMKPVGNLYKQLGYAVPFDNREPMFLIGGFGFGGFINGVRAGGGGYGASAEFRVKKEGANGLDTAIVANVDIGYGGFIIGRNWVKDKHSYYFQTMIGAGSHDVQIEKKAWEGAFGGSADSFDDDDNSKFQSDYESRFFALDLQLGYTKTIMPWFHIGAEVSGLIMYSRSGFDYDNYASVSPTAKVRFVFGSLR